GGGGRGVAAGERALAVSGDLQLAVEAAALAAGGPADVAAAWAERAGRLMLGRGRYREALPHFERAVSLTPSGVERARRQHALSGAYLRTGALERLGSGLQEAPATGSADRRGALVLTTRAAGRSRVGDRA